MQRFTDLRVWRRSHRLALDVLTIAEGSFDRLIDESEQVSRIVHALRTKVAAVGSTTVDWLSTVNCQLSTIP